MRRLQPPRAALLWLALWLAAASLPRPAHAVGLVSDLSHRLIAITTAFAGTEVLLFGALEEPGADVVVLVRGPLVEQAVRRKSRVGPIWLNTAELRFRAVPGYLAVAASKPLDQLVPPAERARYQLGPDDQPLEPIGAAGRDEREIAAFKAALVRNKQRQGLWAADVGKIVFLGDRLFRTTLAFPANVPPGSYQVQVLEIRDGVVTGAQSSALAISKVGIEAELYFFARNQAALYGLLSVLIAVGAGWGASLAFQRA
ncbi:MAG: TIGR02186 family protein [Geminicoccaceae bacterium]|nr:TIGR02186 family protein [Geminicoccaceae bacterium]MCX8102295.1 TIGR02186 family protein [Geminicoccaceae bacterium]MDW8369375.1 TIGR02186 family protein [Geminicoccaceae bacterium]